MAGTEFARVLTKTEVQFKRASDALMQTKLLSQRDELNAAYEAAFDFEAALEKAVLLARVLPVYTGRPGARERVEELVEQSIPIRIGYTKEGWFCLKIPALLPKKGRGSPIYIQQSLYLGMRHFFSGKVPASYPDCVLIYRHVYDRHRPERAWRDHDNIELNMVTDIVALYLLPDDAPARCAHYYCSASGEEDRTEVYVVPREQFATWLYSSFHDRLEELKLYEDQL